LYPFKTLGQFHSFWSWVVGGSTLKFRV
jgi:hypothetical protein